MRVVNYNCRRIMHYVHSLIYLSKCSHSMIRNLTFRRLQSHIRDVISPKTIVKSYGPKKFVTMQALEIFFGGRRNFSCKNAAVKVLKTIGYEICLNSVQFAFFHYCLVCLFSLLGQVLGQNILIDSLPFAFSLFLFISFIQDVITIHNTQHS